MQLPVFNALNKFSTKSPIRSWLVFCTSLFASFFILSFKRIREAEDPFSEIGELAVASVILATVFYLVVRYLVVWYLDRE